MLTLMLAWRKLLLTESTYEGSSQVKLRMIEISWGAKDQRMFSSRSFCQLFFCVPTSNSNISKTPRRSIVADSFASLSFPK